MSTANLESVKDKPEQDFDPYGDASPMPEVAHQELENQTDHDMTGTTDSAGNKAPIQSSVDVLPGLDSQDHLLAPAENTNPVSADNDKLPGLDLVHSSDASANTKAISETVVPQHNAMIIKADDDQEKSLTNQVQDITKQKDDPAKEVDRPEHDDKASILELMVNTEILDAELVLQDITVQGEQPNGNEAPEVEYDSSAAESSSDDSSSDSDASEESDDDYELLDPAEQARRLMEGDGSDDEGGKTTAGGALKTANEKDDEVIEIPNIQISQETKIEELGKIEAVIGNMVLIKAKTSGEYQVLESGSVLCTSERQVFGAVAETLGRVQEPLYCVRFKNSQTISSFGLERDTTVYYVPEHSYFVFTQALQSLKGSDASNINDEEVGGDEIEFSDDEAEAEYKRQKKLQKQERKGLRGGSNRGRADFPRGTPRVQEHHPSSLTYDDVSMDDQLYTPLVRPSSMNIPGQFASHEQASNGFSRGAGGTRGFGGRGRGGNRGRGDRGNHFGGRQQTAQMPAQGMPSYGFAQQQNQYAPPQIPQQQAPYPGQVFQPYNQFPQAQFSGQQHPYPVQYSQTPQWPGFQQSQQPQQQSPFQGAPNQGNMPSTAPGAFYNPAFFSNQPMNPPG